MPEMGSEIKHSLHATLFVVSICSGVASALFSIPSTNCIADHSLPSMIPKFPIEIIMHVLEHLSDDPSTLKCCTLVCRCWLSPSSLQLFRRVTLSSSPHEDLDLDSRTPLESILLALQSSTRVQQSVQELVIHGCEAQPCHLSLYDLRHLPNFLRLKSLWLSGVHITTRCPPSSADSLIELRGLVRLEDIPGVTTCEDEVEADEFGCSTGLAAFLNLFRRIDELSVDNLALMWRPPFQDGARPIPLPREEPLLLRALHLHTTPSVKTFPVVRSMVDITQVTELSLVMNPDTLPFIGGILQALPNLERLLLSSARAMLCVRPTGFESEFFHTAVRPWHVFMEIPGPVAIPALAKCSKLRTLRISSEWRINAAPNQADMTDAILWRNIIHILYFAPPQIRSVTIQLYFSANPRRDVALRMFEQLGWAAFEALVARAEHLEEVAFENSEPWADGVEGGARASVSDGLRRVLRFGTHDSYY